MTNLFITLVIVTIPTFWLKVAVGRPPIKAESMLERPLPIMPPASSLSLGSLSIAPAVVAEISPIA